MKWSDIDSARRPSSPQTDWVEDRLFDFFGERMDGGCVLVTQDSLLADELGLRGARADDLFRFLDNEFGFRPGADERRGLLSKSATLAELIDRMRAFVEKGDRKGGREPLRNVPPPARTRVDEPARPAETRKPAGRDERPAVEPAPSKAERPMRAPAEPDSQSIPVIDRNAEPSRPKGRPVIIDGVAFTQKRDGPLNEEQWLAGPLYEAYGKTREGFPQHLRRTDGMRCVVIPAAEAVMIGTDADGATDRAPAHRVKVRKFLIDAEPVSVAAYARFLNSIGKVPDSVLAEWCGPGDRENRGVRFPLSKSWTGTWSADPGTEMRPVVLVSWFGANAYSLWANRWDWRYYNGTGTVPTALQDRRIPALVPSERDLYSCLPSEVQWEYAARGAEYKRFPWGDEPATADRVCVARQLQNPFSHWGLDVPVAAETFVNVRLGMSPFGVHHMAGHVRQWCRDWFDPKFYSDPAARKTDACCREPTDSRSERGGRGGTGNPDTVQSCSHRRGRPPHSRGRFLGFRCVGCVDEL